MQNTVWSAPSVFVCAQTIEQEDVAHSLSTRFGWPVLDRPPSKNEPQVWLLNLTADRTELIRPDGLKTHIDFVRGANARHAREASLANQPLARALGVQTFRKKYGEAPRVLDATAGLAQDAWLIAQLGCSVHLLERITVLHVMQHDAKARALLADDHSVRQCAQLLQLHLSNAVDWLKNEGHVQAPDIVYLDPMYPATRKQARVKKGMQMLHDLAGPDTNDENLLLQSLNTATYRVVVKRPKGADKLIGTDAWKGQQTSIASPNTRYDIYHVASTK